MHYSNKIIVAGIVAHSASQPAEALLINLKAYDFTSWKIWNCFHCCSSANIQDEAATECQLEEPLNIITIGMMGHGKSTLLNNLANLDCDHFEAGPGAESKAPSAPLPVQRQGQIPPLHLIDTWGLGDPARCDLGLWKAHSEALSSEPVQKIIVPWMMDEGARIYDSWVVSVTTLIVMMLSVPGFDVGEHIIISMHKKVAEDVLSKAEVAEKLEGMRKKLNENKLYSTVTEFFAKRGQAFTYKPLVAVPPQERSRARDVFFPFLAQAAPNSLMVPEDVMACGGHLSFLAFWSMSHEERLGRFGDGVGYKACKNFPFGEYSSYLGQRIQVFGEPAYAITADEFEKLLMTTQERLSTLIFGQGRYNDVVVGHARIELVCTLEQRCLKGNINTELLQSLQKTCDVQFTSAWKALREIYFKGQSGRVFLPTLFQDIQDMTLAKDEKDARKKVFKRKANMFPFTEKDEMDAHRALDDMDDYHDDGVKKTNDRLVSELEVHLRCTIIHDIITSFDFHKVMGWPQIASGLHSGAREMWNESD
jgi:hypothetical protein